MKLVSKKYSLILAIFAVVALFLPTIGLAVSHCDCETDCGPEPQSEQCVCICCPATLLVASATDEVSHSYDPAIFDSIQSDNLGDIDEWFDDLEQPPQNS